MSRETGISSPFLDTFRGSGDKGWTKLKTKHVDQILEAVLRTPYHETAILGTTSLLHDFLLPTYNDMSTDNHVILIAAVLGSLHLSKKPLKIESKNTLQGILTRLVQVYERECTQVGEKTIIVRCLNYLVSQLHDTIVRRALAPMFSIITWSDLMYRPLRDDLESTYTTAIKKVQGMEPKEKVAHLKISSITSLLCHDLCSTATAKPSETQIEIVNFLCTILSQLSTRRYLKEVIQQSNADLSLSDSTQPDIVFQSKLLQYYLNFPINEFTGEMKSAEQLKDEFTTKEALVQATIYKRFKDTHGDFILNHPSLSEDLSLTSTELSKLDDICLDQLLMAIRIPSQNLTHELKLKAIISVLTPPKDPSQLLSELRPLPTLNTLTETLRTPPSSLPNLASGYLSLADLLVRNYLVLRADAFSGIAQHVISTAQRFKKQKNQDKLTGTSRHASIIHGMKVTKQVTFASSESASYLTSMDLDLKSTQQSSFTEWKSLQPGDVVLLATISEKIKSDEAFETEGLTFLTSGTLLSTSTASANNKGNSKCITLELALDPSLVESGTITLEKYSEVNLIIKLPPKLKGYKATLDAITSIIDTNENVLPEWLLETLLGYGDVNAGDWKNFIMENKIKLGHLNTETLKDALPNYTVDLDGDSSTKKRKVSGKETSDDVGSYDLLLNDGSATVSPSRTTELDLTALTSEQLSAVISSIHDGLTVVSGPSGAGKRGVLVKAALLILKNEPSEKILVVTKNEAALKSLMELFKCELSGEEVFNMMDGADQKDRVEDAMGKLTTLLSKVDELAEVMGEEGAWGNDPETAANFHKYHIQNSWVQYLHGLHDNGTFEYAVESYPFSKFECERLTHDDLKDLQAVIHSNIRHYASIVQIFRDIEKLSPLFFLTSQESRAEYLLTRQARVIGTTIEGLIRHTEKSKILFHNVFVYEASQMTTIETLYPLLILARAKALSVTLFGDEKNIGPPVHDSIIGEMTGLSTSLFEILVDAGVSIFNVQSKCDRPHEIVKELKRFYTAKLEPSQDVNANSLTYKIVKAESTEHHPGFFQNIPEAEATVDAVAELVESGIGASSVVVLTPYESQRVLLQEVAASRLNIPIEIHTIESYRGREAEHVVVSMVREPAKLSQREVVALLSAALRSCVVVTQQKI